MKTLSLLTLYVSIIPCAKRSSSQISKSHALFSFRLMHLSAAPSVPYRSLLAQLLARNADLNLTDQDIEMFLARIRKSLPKSSKAGSMSADELQNYLQSLQKEKS